MKYVKRITEAAPQPSPRTHRCPSCNAEHEVTQGTDPLVLDLADSVLTGQPIRCTRCRRPLVNPVYVGGMPYGHVCAGKVFDPFALDEMPDEG